jgi:hypothetical protein
MSCSSCARWREAKAVVSEADSLLVHHKIVTRDTTALNFAINTLDGPLGHIFARDELAKAYYFMGRNFYYANDFATAADYYILCDRLNPSEPMYKGRVNSCMGFICKQDSCFVEALEFYERANIAFEKTGDKRRVANGLVSIAEQYVNLKDYAKADSVLKIAARYDVDSAYYARILDVYALAHYNQQLYDSALVHLLNIKDYPRNLDARCYSYLMIAKCYNKLLDINEAKKYAEYVITHSSNSSFRSNAYYILIQSAEIEGNINQLAEYSKCREDEDRILQHLSESCAQASAKLREYINYPIHIPLKEILIVLFCIIVIAVWAIWYSHKIVNRKIASEKKLMEQEIAKWKEGILQKMNEEKVISEIEKRKMILNVVMNYADEFAIDKPIWDNDTKLFRLADSCFGFIIYRLKHTYHLRNCELKICLMVLLDFPNKEIARMVSYKEDSYPTIKRRLATKLGTSSSEMRNFLLDLIVKIL